MQASKGRLPIIPAYFAPWVLIGIVLSCSCQLNYASTVVSNVSGYCPDEDFNGELFAERIVQRPTNKLLIKTQGSATENIAEIQTLQMWSHEVIDITINASSLIGGSWILKFCEFDVQLPGSVDRAPLPNTNSDNSLISVSVDSGNVNTAWQEAGLVAGDSIRISTSPSKDTQDREIYVINYSDCGSGIDGCGTDVIKLDKDYAGSKIAYDGSANSLGAAWSCSWSSASTVLPFNATENMLQAAFEEVLGSGSVESVTRSAIITNERQGYVYRVQLAKGVINVHAGLNTSELQGSGIIASARTIVRGASNTTTYATESAYTGFTGTFTLSLEGQETTQIPLTASASTLSTALSNLETFQTTPIVTKASDGWSWTVTFGNAGEQEKLLSSFSDSTTAGITLKTVRSQSGLSTLAGNFELMNLYSNISATVPAEATATELEEILENNFGLSDVVVNRSNADESNGYEWTVDLTNDCPTSFTLDNSDMLYITPACELALQRGSETSSLLKGTNASLSVVNIVSVDLGETWEGTPVAWVEVARVPESLPSSEIAGSLCVLPLSSEERGRYTFEARYKSNASLTLGTQLVYVDAIIPEANVGASYIEVPYPSISAELSAEASVAFYDSELVSYEWSVFSTPETSRDISGQISSPNSTNTTILSLDTPGVFEYILRVTDDLGLQACILKEVDVSFIPAILQNLANISLAPGDSLVLNCTASGAVPIEYAWFLNDDLLEETSAILEVSEVTEEDQGVYACIVSNNVGMAESNTAFVNVYNLAIIDSSPESVVGSIGGTVSLSCTTTSSLPLEVFWERQTQDSAEWEIYSSEVVSRKSEEEKTITFSMTIYGLQSSDQGDYRCVVSNSAGESASDIGYVYVSSMNSTGVSTAVTSNSLAVRLANSNLGLILNTTWSWLGQAENLGASKAGLTAGPSHLVASFVVSMVLATGWIILSVCMPTTWQVLGTERWCRLASLFALVIKAAQVTLATHLDAPTMRAGSRIFTGANYHQMTAVFLVQVILLFWGQFITAGTLSRATFILAIMGSITFDAAYLSELEVLLECAQLGICGVREYDLLLMEWRVVLLLWGLIMEFSAFIFCAYFVFLIGPCGIAKFRHSTELLSKAEFATRYF